MKTEIKYKGTGKPLLLHKCYSEIEMNLCVASFEALFHIQHFLAVLILGVGCLHSSFLFFLVTEANVCVHYALSD